MFLEYYQRLPNVQHAEAARLVVRHASGEPVLIVLDVDGGLMISRLDDPDFREVARQLGVPTQPVIVRDVRPKSAEVFIG
jgi:hypothetical protein